MKASELRIGNYVLDKGTVCTVDGIQFPNNDVVTEDKTYDDYCRIIKPEGIPITEEWLVKFDFEPEYEVGGDDMEIAGGTCYQCCNHKTGCEELIEKNGKFFYVKGTGSSDDGSSEYQYVPIQFVHQLQNLYFAITGEELTVKP